MRIYMDEDSGNIEVISLEDANNICLNIRKDNNDDRFQWFNFYFEGRPGKEYFLHIDNAGQAAFPKWDKFDCLYQTTASYDGIDWFRVPTVYDPHSGKLTIHMQEMKQERIQFAFFPPYSYEKHQQLIEKAKLIPTCNVTSIGKTVEGRDITLVSIGAALHKKKNCWIIARQHPGETMAEWFMEGLIERVLSGEDLSELLANTVIHLVPNMNPDGTYHGNLRTNAAGVDLNRAWLNPHAATSPEVFYVREKMQEVGVDFFMDVHGDESHPNVFPQGRGVGCSPNEFITQLEKKFIQDYMEVNPHLQKNSCYEADKPGEADLRIAVSWVAEHLNCLSLLIEMPFKGVKKGTATIDWTLNDCKQLGADLLTPLQRNLANIKAGTQNNTKESCTEQCEESVQTSGMYSFTEDNRLSIGNVEKVIVPVVPHHPGCGASL